MKTFGLTARDINQEVRAILTGDIDINARLARQLKITRQQIEAEKAKGTLLNFYFEKLGAVTAANEVFNDSLENTFSVIQSAKKEFQRAIGDAAFEEFEQGLLGFRKILEDNRDLILEWGGEIGDVAGAAFEQIITAVEAFTEVLLVNKDGIQSFVDAVITNFGDVVVFLINSATGLTGILGGLGNAMDDLSLSLEVWYGKGGRMIQLIGLLNPQLFVLGSTMRNIQKQFRKGLQFEVDRDLENFAKIGKAIGKKGFIGKAKVAFANFVRGIPGIGGMAKGMIDLYNDSFVQMADNGINMFQSLQRSLADVTQQIEDAAPDTDAWEQAATRLKEIIAAQESLSEGLEGDLKETRQELDKMGADLTEDALTAYIKLQDEAVNAAIALAKAQNAYLDGEHDIKIATLDRLDRERDALRSQLETGRVSGMSLAQQKEIQEEMEAIAEEMSGIGETIKSSFDGAGGNIQTVLLDLKDLGTNAEIASDLVDRLVKSIRNLADPSDIQKNLPKFLSQFQAQVRDGIITAGEYRDIIEAVGDAARKTDDLEFRNKVMDQALKLNDAQLKTIEQTIKPIQEGNNLLEKRGVITSNQNKVQQKFLETVTQGAKTLEDTMDLIADADLTDPIIFDGQGAQMFAEAQNLQVEKQELLNELYYAQNEAQREQIQLKLQQNDEAAKSLAIEAASIAQQRIKAGNDGSTEILKAQKIQQQNEKILIQLNEGVTEEKRAQLSEIFNANSAERQALLLAAEKKQQNNELVNGRHELLKLQKLEGINEKLAVDLMRAKDQNAINQIKSQQQINSKKREELAIEAQRKATEAGDAGMAAAAEAAQLEVQHERLLIQLNNEQNEQAKKQIQDQLALNREKFAEVDAIQQKEIANHSALGIDLQQNSASVLQNALLLEQKQLEARLLKIDRESLDAKVELNREITKANAKLKTMQGTAKLIGEYGDEDLQNTLMKTLGIDAQAAALKRVEETTKFLTKEEEKLLVLTQLREENLIDQRKVDDQILAVKQATNGVIDALNAAEQTRLDILNSQIALTEKRYEVELNGQDNLVKGYERQLKAIEDFNNPIIAKIDFQLNNLDRYKNAVKKLGELPNSEFKKGMSESLKKLAPQFKNLAQDGIIGVKEQIRLVEKRYKLEQQEADAAFNLEQARMQQENTILQQQYDIEVLKAEAAAEGADYTTAVLEIQLGLMKEMVDLAIDLGVITKEDGEKAKENIDKQVKATKKVRSNSQKIANSNKENAKQAKIAADQAEKQAQLAKEIADGIREGNLDFEKLELFLKGAEEHSAGLKSNLEGAADAVCGIPDGEGEGDEEDEEDAKEIVFGGIGGLAAGVKRDLQTFKVNFLQDLDKDAQNLFAEGVARLGAEASQIMNQARRDATYEYESGAGLGRLRGGRYASLDFAVVMEKYQKADTAAFKAIIANQKSFLKKQERDAIEAAEKTAMEQAREARKAARAQARERKLEEIRKEVRQARLEASQHAYDQLIADAQNAANFLDGLRDFKDTSATDLLQNSDFIDMLGLSDILADDDSAADQVDTAQDEAYKLLVEQYGVTVADLLRELVELDESIVEQLVKGKTAPEDLITDNKIFLNPETGQIIVTGKDPDFEKLDQLLVLENIQDFTQRTANATEGLNSGEKTLDQLTDFETVMAAASGQIEGITLDDGAVKGLQNTTIDYYDESTATWSEIAKKIRSVDNINKNFVNRIKNGEYRTPAELLNAFKSMSLTEQSVREVATGVGQAIADNLDMKIDLPDEIAKFFKALNKSGAIEKLGGLANLDQLISIGGQLGLREDEVLDLTTADTNKYDGDNVIDDSGANDNRAVIGMTGGDFKDLLREYDKSQKPFIGNVDYDYQFETASGDPATRYWDVPGDQRPSWLNQNYDWENNAKPTNVTFTIVNPQGQNTTKTVNYNSFSQYASDYDYQDSVTSTTFGR